MKKLFKETRTNPRTSGTAGLHFVAVLDDGGNSTLHVFDSEDQAGLYHGQLRGYGGIKRIGRLKGSGKLSMDYIVSGTAKQFGSKPEVIRHDVANNPVRQRIAVSLSKSQARRNPLLESGATISRNSGINRRAASMT